MLPAFQTITALLPGVQIGILSNTDEDTVTAAVKHTGLLVQYIMSSERAHCYKPNPEIFRMAMRELGISSRECLYIGNSIGDIAGASAASISSVFINRDHKQLPEAYHETPVLNSLIQLDPVLRDHSKLY